MDILQNKVTLFVALFAEAKPLIVRYGLKRCATKHRFQTFQNETGSLTLILTGVGVLSAAVAVADYYATKESCKDEVLINYGSSALLSAADTDRGGEIFLCNKIVQNATKRTFYPDVLYQHPFAEATLVTGDVFYSGQQQVHDVIAQERAVCLYDMEAAAIYQAGIYYLAPQQMFFLKTVTDAGTNAPPDMERFSQYLCKNIEKVCAFVDSFLCVEREQSDEKLRITGEAFVQETDTQQEARTAKLAADLHCSAVMEAALYQFVKYCTLSHMAIWQEVARLYEEGKLPCTSKREGKVVFDELKASIL